MSDDEVVRQLFDEYHYATWLGASEVVVLPIRRALFARQVRASLIADCDLDAVSLRGQRHRRWTGAF